MQLISSERTEDKFGDIVSVRKYICENFEEVTIMLAGMGFKECITAQRKNVDQFIITIEKKNV